jgi:hypothetical protein
LTGDSDGALVAAAVSMGVHPEDGMKATLAIVDRARQAGTLGHLQLGNVEINETDLDCCWMCFSFNDIGLSYFIFSLIDQVEEFLLELTRDVDEEYVWRRMDNGQLL